MKGFYRIRRALVSVSDKSGLLEIAAALRLQDVEILSTGGTAEELRAGGFDVIDVADYTRFPEIMDGRVKTLHPKIHGGLLSLRDNLEHAESMQIHQILPIDLLISNLYPFEQTLKSGADAKECMENIDVGGPAMIRAASKNYESVTVLVDPKDYSEFIDEFTRCDGSISLKSRYRFASIAFARTAAYDAEIAAWLASETKNLDSPWITFIGHNPKILRYGENPHQKAVFYNTGQNRPGVATATQIQGKDLSFNNLNDTDAAFELVSEFELPSAVIVKHANPCGVAQNESILVAYRRAFFTDPTSAFGGIVALNRKLNGATAEEIIKTFTEVIIAPEIDEDARRILAKKKNLRVLEAGSLPDHSQPGRIVKSISGGLLVQDRDFGRIMKSDLKVVTKRKPNKREFEDLLFAFRVVKHVKSNAIVFAKNGASVGIGAGQMSRVDASRIAVQKAQESGQSKGIKKPVTLDSVVASDAFFPFADGLITTIDAGAKAVVQPGGSVRDDEVIAAADEHDIAMVFTGIRHFRH